MIKDYIITYRSSEHYEVLGWVRAETMEEAKNKAKIELKEQTKKYGVINVMIAEWREADNFSIEI
ncbi:MAG: hypothetical protein PHQ01_01455 [Candidatus Pacebacteria bacterium]|nr:hypothetical protein [Candidatus Paceibacterota bacterium]